MPNKIHRCSVPLRGTSQAPTYDASRIDLFPAPREHFHLATRINWAFVRNAIDAGKAVRFAISPEDTEALRDVIYNRLGYDVVTRWGSDTLFVCRPWALLEASGSDDREVEA